MEYVEVVIKLVLASVLSGIIGFEREAIHKPAGFRTHILVCLGSTLVMIVSLYAFNNFRIYEEVNSKIDLGRMPAQVISGIGFLGAGTIIKTGVNIKGLTTAASLWAAGCVGLAIGIGFYGAAVITTFIIIVVLKVLGKLENVYMSKKNIVRLGVVAANRPGQVGRICTALGELKIYIKNIEFNRIDKEQNRLDLMLELPEQIVENDIIDKLSSVDGNKKVFFL